MDINRIIDDLPDDVLIFTFIGYDWRMDLSDYFFFNKSLARCRAALKNAFICYYKNKDEIYKLKDWMKKVLKYWEHDPSCPKTAEKFRKILDYIGKEEEKYAY